MVPLPVTGAATRGHGGDWEAVAHASHFAATQGFWQQTQKMSWSISVKWSSHLNLKPGAQVCWKLSWFMLPYIKRVRGWGGVRSEKPEVGLIWSPVRLSEMFSSSASPF